MSMDQFLAKLVGMPKGSLPDLDIGAEIGGCTFLGSVLGGSSGRITFWKLRCECGYEFESLASDHWYNCKDGKKKLCKNKHLHQDIKVGSHFVRLTIVDFVKRPYGNEVRAFAVCDAPAAPRVLKFCPSC